MTRIVVTSYRYKRPPRKTAKAAPLDVPAIVRSGHALPFAGKHSTTDDRKPAIVITASRKRGAAARGAGTGRRRRDLARGEGVLRPHDSPWWRAAAEAAMTARQVAQQMTSRPATSSRTAEGL
jgi:hypothetical protein